jgi:hypothetical protein
MQEFRCAREASFPRNGYEGVNVAKMDIHKHNQLIVQIFVLVVNGSAALTFVSKNEAGHEY